MQIGAPLAIDVLFIAGAAADAATEAGAGLTGDYGQAIGSI